VEVGPKQLPVCGLVSDAVIMARLGVEEDQLPGRGRQMAAVEGEAPAAGPGIDEQKIVRPPAPETLITALLDVMAGADLE